MGLRPVCCYITDACWSNPCEHGGTCTVDEFGNPDCECVDGFSGTYCSIIYGGTLYCSVENIGVMLILFIMVS